MKVSLTASSEVFPAGAAHAWLHAGPDLGNTAALHGAPWPAEWRHNRLLAELPEATRQRWLAHAECVHLGQGQMLHEAGAVLQWVYFPLTALIALVMPERTGAIFEVATVGREGVVGLPLLGGNYTRSRAVVQAAGKAIRMRASVLAEEFAKQPDVRGLLLAYSQALVAEIMQTALCNRHHSLEQQVARLILLRLDRQAGEELSMTQEAMAGMLGVRRESVTLAAARLQQAGVIRYARGHITVLARARLEGRACDCYDTIRCEFDRLLQPLPAA